MSRIHQALEKAKLGLSVVDEPRIESVLDPAFLPQAVEVKNASSGKEIAWKEDATESASPDHFEFDQLRKSCKQHQWHPTRDVNIFADASTGSACAEQFRSLRSRLSQLKNSQNLRTVLVTSAAPREGKTFVVANLAQAIVCQPNLKTLVIDADLRCSSLHQVMGAPSTPGLSDYLRGAADEAAIVQFGDSQNRNLSLIPGGNKITNPSELLSNGRMETLLKRVAPAFDWVIIDSPPCVPVSDASLLAGLADGVLVVIKAASTSSALVRKAREELRKNNIVGLVLNSVEETAAAYGSYVTAD
jgi:protein-tyrosine kinase